MSSSWQALQEAFGPRLFAAYGAVLQAILLWIADVYVAPRGKTAIIYSYQLSRLHVLKDRLRLQNMSLSGHILVLVFWLVLTQLSIHYAPIEYKLRILYFLSTPILNASFTFWFHLKTDRSDMAQFTLWIAARDALVTYVACTLSITYWSLSWSVAKFAAQYMCAPLVCYLAGLWGVARWERYPMLISGMAWPIDKLLMAMIMFNTTRHVLFAMFVEDLPNFFQRTYACYVVRRKRMHHLPLYDYQPLKKGEIRLLVLKRSFFCWPSMLRTELIHVPWWNNRESYEAVSYRWGSPKQQRTIIVNGRLFHITDSAFELLLARRSTFRDRAIWIDAICINQGDDAEKEEQITMMRSIYQDASRVVVFLGNGWRIRLAAHILYGIHFGLRIPWFDINIAAGLKYAPRRSALKAVLLDEYFTRAWIIQEIVVADVVEFYLAGRYVPWEVFVEVSQGLFDPHRRRLLTQSVSMMHTHSVPATTFGNVSVLASLNIAHQQKLFIAPSMTLEGLLFLTTAFRATDPRDKVFSLLGLTRLVES